MYKTDIQLDVCFCLPARLDVSQAGIQKHQKIKAVYKLLKIIFHSLKFKNSFRPSFYTHNNRNSNSLNF